MKALAILAITGVALGEPNSVRVLASNGVRAVVDELKPQCERAIGHPLAIQFGSTTDLVKKINAGEAFDVTILTTEAIDQLIQSGKLGDAFTRADIARCGVGVGIRAGAPKPDISSPEAMKTALLKSKAVAYAEDGASRGFVEKMEQHLGITDQMKTKTILTHGSVAANAKVTEGQADMVLTLGSEILPIPGMQLVGPLPAALQGYVNFAAVAKPDAAAAAVVRFLKSPAAAPVYKAKGMEAR